MNKKAELKSLALLFLKLGSIAFGGPAAHIAMMEQEVVRKRKWMTHEHFLDLVGATNIIPGPNSTEMTMHCGHERAGWAGLVVAGLSFILPAVLITMLLAWLYGLYGHLPNVLPFIYGIKPAVIAIIVSAIIPLAKKAVKNYELAVLGSITAAACMLGLNEIIALFGCGALGLLLYFIKANNRINSFTPLLLVQAIADPLAITNMKIFLTFLKVGAVLYGSGYVLFAFLDAELVMKGFMSREQLIDAVAVGQFTPGPVLSTATFIGWQLNGWQGALLATAGIFLPSFLFVALLNPLIPRIRKSKAASAFLDAVNVASVALIAVVIIAMGRESLIDWKTMLIAVIGFLVVFKMKKLNSAFVVIGGSLLGYALTFI